MYAPGPGDLLSLKIPSLFYVENTGTTERRLKCNFLGSYVPTPGDLDLPPDKLRSTLALPMVALG